MTNGPVIWIVDDDPSTLRLVARNLALQGFTPVPFKSAEEAYAMLSDDALPALIVLDMLLPGMSGVDLIRLLKQNSVWEKIPVVVMSVLTQKETADAGHAEESAAAYWVNKPFETHDLIETIQGILKAVK